MKRVGIVGAGSMGKYHAARWAKLPAELTGFYDIDAQVGQDAAERFQTKAFESMEALLEACDLVVVTTPTFAHHEVVMAAAEAQKAIFCEKPMARYLWQCQEMIETCKANGSRLFVGQVVRFFPEFVQAKQTLDSGAIGEPGVVRTTRGGAHPSSSAWYADYEKSGGVILDLAVHDLDYVQWCCGDVERVFARGLIHKGLRSTDYALLTLRFKAGTIGHVEASWAYPRGVFFTKLEIAGDDGLLEFDSRESTPLQVQFSHAEGRSDGLTIPESPLAAEDDPYFQEDKHFLECVEDGKPFAIQPEEAMQAVRVALAAIESVRTNQPVDIDAYEEVA